MGSRPVSLLSRSYRIGSVLTLIAILPLIGTTWFAVGDVLQANSERTRTATVDASVRELVALSELRTSLLDERNWSASDVGIQQLGLTSDLVATLSGIDVSSERSRAVDRVDSLLIELDLPSVASRVGELRVATDRPLLAIGQEYEQVENEVAALAGEVLDDLLLNANAMPDGGRLTAALRVLQVSTMARQAVSAEFNHYFAAQFADGVDRGEETVRLIAQDTRRRDAMEEAARIAPPGSASFAAVQELLASEESAVFADAVQTLINETVTGKGPEADLAAVLADLDGVARTFEASSRSSERYLDLVDAAGADSLAASKAAGAEAARRNIWALVVLAFLSLVSAVVALAATRVIGRPVAQLARAARHIRDGRPGEQLTFDSGPIEIREAARAINEAGHHLVLAERQALALAQGDLGHESLAQSVSGALGASLQSAVQTLAASLHDREEFRTRMTYEATHDSLTQLPNRSASLVQLERGLDRTKGGTSLLAALFIDLDGFKDVNDHHGHPAGDAVLRVIAQRLVAIVRPFDHVGRLGGDEFLVIAEPVTDIDAARRLADRVRATLAKPIRIEGATVAVDASVGIAVSGQPGTTPSGLLRDADLAVYHAKAQGRGRVEVFTEQLRAQLIERVDLEAALRSALDGDEFILYYQPIVEPALGAPVGYEALVRWNRPGHGMINPDDFIPFAERSDLIIDIDKWVLRSAARQIVAWEADGQLEGASISINLSGRHLASPDFVANVIDPLDEYGIDPARIIVEITESALLDDLGSAAEKLQRLRNRGIRTAIDDFGTGYTSLAHLRRLPIDIVKIDRSFTGDDSAVSLVQLIIDTGHLLGATITAEGVETEDQAASLIRMGSDDLQGFFYGRPAPASELDDSRLHSSTA